MRVPQPPLVTIAFAVTACLAIMVAVGFVGPHTPIESPGLPSVEVDAVDLGAMLAAPEIADAATKGTFVDERGERVPVKVARRGFSSWHRGDTKPSLRLEQNARPAPLRPRHVELSRPEDPLALANLVPDVLLQELGLPHGGTAAVGLRLDGRDAGIYLRSLRPGDDLAAACGLPRGTFWKGDALGERRHENLWADASAWRDSGRPTAHSRARLEDLLAVLRAPATADNLQQLAALVDLDATARTFAVQTLVAGNHADRAHNHVWFFDPTRDAFVPLLWDANGFGMHAEPTLPVDLARHPLADRLLCEPRFLARRDAALFELLHGQGSPDRLVAFATRQLTTLRPILTNDPEIARLVLRHGEFRAQRVAATELDGELATFATFVQARAHFLRNWLEDARVAVADDPTDPTSCCVTVFGNVAVTVARRDGTDVLAIDGGKVTTLWPGRSAERNAAPQRADQDGKGVAAPHAAPAPLTYRLRGTPDAFVFRAATTDAPVSPTNAPAPLVTCSVHPWTAEPAPTTVTFGPGTVPVTARQRFAAATTVIVLPGTRVEFAAGAGWHLRGPLLAQGLPDAPIEFVAAGGDAPLRCCGDVEFEFVQMHGPNAPLLALHGSRANLQHVIVRGASGNGLEVDGGDLTAERLDIALCRGHGLLASANARVDATGGRFAFNDHGVWARDGATVTLTGGELAGNMVGAFAEGTPAPMIGGTIALHRVHCHDAGRLDADANGDGVVRLVDTTGKTGPGLAKKP